MNGDYQFTQVHSSRKFRLYDSIKLSSTTLWSQVRLTSRFMKNLTEPAMMNKVDIILISNMLSCILELVDDILDSGLGDILEKAYNLGYS
jgi:hypothetical protein